MVTPTLEEQLVKEGWKCLRLPLERLFSTRVPPKDAMRFLRNEHCLLVSTDINDFLALGNRGSLPLIIVRGSLLPLATKAKDHTQTTSLKKAPFPLPMKLKGTLQCPRVSSLVIGFIELLNIGLSHISQSTGVLKTLLYFGCQIC